MFGSCDVQAPNPVQKRGATARYSEGYYMGSISCKRCDKGYNEAQDLHGGCSLAGQRQGTWTAYKSLGFGRVISVLTFCHF